MRPNGFPENGCVLTERRVSGQDDDANAPIVQLINELYMPARRLGD